MQQQQQEIMINPVNMQTARTLQVICLPNSSPRRRIEHTHGHSPIYKSLNNYMNIYLCKHKSVNGSKSRMKSMNSLPSLWSRF